MRQKNNCLTLLYIYKIVPKCQIFEKTKKIRSRKTTREKNWIAATKKNNTNKMRRKRNSKITRKIINSKTPRKNNY